MSGEPRLLCASLRQHGAKPNESRGGGFSVLGSQGVGQPHFEDPSMWPPSGGTERPAVLVCSLGQGHPQMGSRLGDPHPAERACYSRLPASVPAASSCPSFAGKLSGLWPPCLARAVWIIPIPTTPNPTHTSDSSALGTLSGPHCSSCPWSAAFSADSDPTAAGDGRSLNTQKQAPLSRPPELLHAVGTPKEKPFVFDA